MNEITSILTKDLWMKIVLLLNKIIHKDCAIKLSLSKSNSWSVLLYFFRFLGQITNESNETNCEIKWVAKSNPFKLIHFQNSIYYSWICQNKQFTSIKTYAAPTHRPTNQAEFKRPSLIKLTHSGEMNWSLSPWGGTKL